ncbi:MAG: hypothetical protein KME57_34880 [Scytonema hyalinum WJT4-NPBG1]|nr:hypothetical protein [Scytonema hyalinum WJT4-NPBG1]
MLDAIATIATYTNNNKYCAALQHHAEMILQDSCEALSQEQDRKDLQERYHTIIKALDCNSAINNWD